MIPKRTPMWEVVAHDGERKPFAPDTGAAISFAQEAANAFGVGESRAVEFDGKVANEALKEKAGGKIRSKKGG